jgi:hypothetical protein
MLLLDTKHLLSIHTQKINYSCGVYDIHEITLNLLEEKTDLQTCELHQLVAACGFHGCVVEVSGQLHPRGKSPWYPLDRRLGGHQSQARRHVEVKIFAPLGLKL